MKELVIAALTPSGLELGRRLAQGLGYGQLVSVQGDSRTNLEELFQAGHPLVCIMALGIVVRFLGPQAQNKENDPAVVVVDEAGQFAISVLGGHAAGANELAQQVANAIGAMPVITTASDALGLPAVDLIGREWGWKIEGRDNLTRVAAAIVRGEPVGVYQTAGREDWWQVFGDWPATFQRIESAPEGYWAAILVISDSSLPGTLPYATVIFRPPTLVLGVGCRRGVPCSEIEAMFEYLCRTQGFSPLSLGVVATASLKADEPGLVEFAARHGVPLLSFSIEELGRVADLPTPSERVRAQLGIAGVAEPAALLAAGAKELLVPKQRGPRVTMALARREDA
jgi:cobalamin biosynthesis protein CbiG